MAKLISWFLSLFKKKQDGGISGGGSPAAPVQVKNPVETQKQFFLSWDSKAERRSWTEWLLKYFSDKEVLSVFNYASDITKVIPQWKTLSDEMKSYFLSEFICRLAYYECAWNPKDASVDVGTQVDKDTWSVGLLQMSVVDQKNYKLSFGFNYSDLQDPINNMTLGLEIMKRQIKSKGKILIVKPEKGAYWSTLNVGNSHDKSQKIISEIQKWCIQSNEISSQNKMSLDQIRNGLVDEWKKDLGKKEINGKNRSPLIDSICAFFGEKLGSPYCIGGLLYRANDFCKNNNLKNPLPKTMGTQNFYSQSPEKYKKQKGLKLNKSDIAIQQQYKDPDHGHAYGICEDEITDQKSIEYNTDPSGGRDGDGVYEGVRTQSGDSTKRYLGGVDIAKWIYDSNFI